MIQMETKETKLPTLEEVLKKRDAQRISVTLVQPLKRQMPQRLPETDYMGPCHDFEMYGALRFVEKLCKEKGYQIGLLDVDTAVGVAPCSCCGQEYVDRFLREVGEQRAVVAFICEGSSEQKYSNSVMPYLCMLKDRVPK